MTKKGETESTISEKSLQITRNQQRSIYGHSSAHRRTFERHIHTSSRTNPDEQSVTRGNTLLTSSWTDKKAP